METENTKKTDPNLVFLIIAILLIGSAFAFKKIINLQGEEKIRLAKQGKENLNEPLVTGTGQKIEIPPLSSAESDTEEFNLPINESAKPAATQPAQTPVSLAKPPLMNINKETKYEAVLNTTEGKIVIKLDSINTPITANNFISLAKKNFYDSTIFHRVIEGFMIQGGDPEGTGRGGPGYRFDDEPIVGEYERGTVAMANAGPNTNGSQFFIMHKTYPLSKNYVIFGKVVEGIETVDKIAEAPVVQNNGEMSKPINPVSIDSVEIIETPVESIQ